MPRPQPAKRAPAFLPRPRASAWRNPSNGLSEFRSPDRAQRNPGIGAPHFASLHTGYTLQLSSAFAATALFDSMKRACFAKDDCQRRVLRRPGDRNQFGGLLVVFVLAGGLGKTARVVPRCRSLG